MTRARKGAQRRQTRKLVMKGVKGHRGAAGRNYRLAKEANVRALVNARVGRKQKKRTYRAMWITRLSAACRLRDIRYSQFISALKKAHILLNRKMLSEIAIADPPAFDAIVQAARAALA